VIATAKLVVAPYNTKKRKLVGISNIPPNSKVCQTC